MAHEGERLLAGGAVDLARVARRCELTAGGPAEVGYSCPSRSASAPRAAARRWNRRAARAGAGQQPLQWRGRVRASTGGPRRRPVRRGAPQQAVQRGAGVGRRVGEHRCNLLRILGVRRDAAARLGQRRPEPARVLAEHLARRP